MSLAPQSARQRVRHVEMWGDAFTPPCKCGCGEPVTFSAGTSTPQQFVNTRHLAWWKQSTGVFTRGGLESGRVRAAKNDALDIAQFRRAVRTIATKKGWTLEETARRGGWTRGGFNAHMYAKHRKTIGRETAEKFLRRLAGQATTPTAHMHATRTRDLHRESLALSQIHNRYMR